METTFRWRSRLGASVIVFLIFGVINVGLAIAVPATLHLNGSFPGVVFGLVDPSPGASGWGGILALPVAVFEIILLPFWLFFRGFKMPEAP